MNLDKLKTEFEAALAATLTITFLVEHVEADDHDGRDEEPVACLTVCGFDLYPLAGERQSIAGPVPVTRWAVDVAVGGPTYNDPFACPDIEEIGLYDSPYEAMTQIIGHLAMTQVGYHFEAEGEAAEAAEARALGV